MPTAAETAEPKLAGPHGGGPRDLWPDDPGGGGDDGGDSQYVPGAGLFAMRFVLVSITTLFITIGVAYFARSRSSLNWQHIRVPGLLWLSTALILASSWTLESARGCLERKNSQRYAHWLELTLGIGLAFLASQLLALRELVTQGIYLRHNPHSSLFYVLTGAHGIHLLGGMAALCYLLLRASLRPESVLLDFRRQRTRAAVSALYWHFLTLLWLGLFLGLLLWP
jgi:cytochrome c oxidase subunit 3